jgi:FkbM family methyltransferase
MNSIKNLIKSILHDVLGLDVRRVKYIPVSETPEVALQRLGVDLVLDVGANRGQFASRLRRRGYTGRIVSFEPLSSAHEALRQASSGDAMWDVFPRCALGERDGEVEINIAGNSESSSILPMLESHRSAAPQSAYLGKETVKLMTLDEAAQPYLKEARSTFLKIDTQGFEWQVLDGARATLPHVNGVLLELSLVQLYEGQHLWREVIARLEAEGFALWAFTPVFSDPVSRRMLQIDGLFFRVS